MKLLIAIDHHFVRESNGRVHVGPPMSLPGFSFWEPYLQVFEEVSVLARVRQTNDKADGPQADGPGVTFSDLPDYFGPWEFLRCRGRLIQELMESLRHADAFVLRVPGTIGQLAWKNLRQNGKPYGLEVVADPWDILSPGSARSVVRPLARRMSTLEIRKMCHEAPAVSYVTREALQSRYPPGPHTWSTYASDVDIGGRLASQAELQSRIERLERRFSIRLSPGEGFRVGFLGALAQLYKAPDILLRAVAACLRSGLNLDLAIAGDGRYRESLERLAASLGIRNRVTFLGALSSAEQVWQFLDQVDLFVLPSRQEGLPRAMVEAMARGCPCIGSAVGGIPELLSPSDLVPPDDVNSLAAKIQEMLSSRNRMAGAAARNLEKAREYLPGVLMERRLAFYRQIRRQAEITAAGAVKQ